MSLFFSFCLLSQLSRLMDERVFLSNDVPEGSITFLFGNKPYNTTTTFYTELVIRNFCLIVLKIELEKLWLIEDH